MRSPAWQMSTTRGKAPPASVSTKRSLAMVAELLGDPRPAVALRREPPARLTEIQAPRGIAQQADHRRDEFRRSVGAQIVLTVHQRQTLGADTGGDHGLGHR